jgi:hypothetical protein
MPPRPVVRHYKVVGAVGGEDSLEKRVALEEKAVLVVLREHCFVRIQEE